MAELLTFKPEFEPRRYFFYSALILFMTIIAGTIMSLLQGQVTPLSNITYDWAVIPISFEQSGFSPTSFPGYFLHNSSIIIGGWISGIGIFGPFFILWQNGMNIATYIVTSLHMPLSRTVFRLSFLLPHGIFEIPAIVIGLGASIYIARASAEAFFTGNARPIDLTSAITDTVPWIVVSISLLVVAAFVESTFSVPFAEWMANMVA